MPVRKLTALLALTLLSACSSLPARNGIVAGTRLAPATAGALAESADRITGPLAAGESAFWLLDKADWSFDVRLMLVDHAVSSLDIQYFIWEKDPSSRLYSHRILQAADRGVRVRLLLDDLTLNGQDAEFLALSKHPNIEVRSFNPWTARSNLGRIAEFMFHFGQLNHRMHNKIVVADGHFAIVGGRNIGDRYFGLWEEFVQNDLDVMGAGSITAEVAAGFDDYWNSTESFPLDLLARPKARATELAEISAFIQAFYLEAAGKLQSFPLEVTTWESLLKHLENTAAIGRARLVQDLPEVSQAQPTQLIEPLNAFLAQARERVLISSPYFLPDDEFVRLLERLEAAGVEVVILTNSLASNNHMIAHSGYEPWRKRLLQGGMELFESRDDSASLAFYSTPPIKPAFLGLHSKAIVVDGRYSYIGSANIDPRSLIYNTELAMFMDSETLAARLSALIERDMAPDAAWRVSLNERGRLRWTSSAGTVKRQPALNFLQRVTEFFINLLPIKQQA